MVWKFIKTVFADVGDKTTISDTTSDNTVSMSEGYTSDYSEPSSSPLRKLPERTKWNYLLNVITSVLQQYQKHSVPEFITESDNGGTPFSYSRGESVRFDGGSGYSVYESLVNNNTDLPTSTTSWAVRPRQVASDEDTVVGTDNVKIITPAKLRLGVSYSLSLPGFMIFPTWLGGLVLQWGYIITTTYNNGFNTVNFPVTFPTEGLVILASPREQPTGYVGAGFVSSSSGRITSTSSLVQNIWWFALGH